MLLDRKKVKFWQRIVFGAMAVLMGGFLVFGYSGVLSSCQESGGVLSPTKRLDEEIAALQARLAQSPKDTEALRNLAIAYFSRGNQQEPDSAAQRNDWLRAADAYEQADRLLARRKGAAAKEQRVDVFESLVSVYISLQQFDQATAVYGTLTDIEPQNAEFFFAMGSMAVQAGDTDTALLAFQRFLELAPDSSEAPAVKEWVKANTPKGGGQ